MFARHKGMPTTARTLRGILNAGHQRNRPYIRWDAAARSRESCPTFAMAALAGIGEPARHDHGPGRHHPDAPPRARRAG